MRHRNTGRQLSRNSSHRKALMMNLSIALIEHELIKTTLAKAKELRMVVEPYITRAKTDSVANRRLLFSRLRSKSSVSKLFEELGVRFKARAGGYVRIIKCGYRTGDNAPMAIIEFVERAEPAKRAPKPKADVIEAVAEKVEAKKPAAKKPKTEKAETPEATAKAKPAPKAEPKKKPAVKKASKPKKAE